MNLKLASVTTNEIIDELRSRFEAAESGRIESRIKQDRNGDALCEFCKHSSCVITPANEVSGFPEVDESCALNLPSLHEGGPCSMWEYEFRKPTRKSFVNEIKERGWDKLIPTPHGVGIFKGFVRDVTTEYKGPQGEHGAPTGIIPGESCIEYVIDGATYKIKISDFYLDHEDSQKNSEPVYKNVPGVEHVTEAIQDGSSIELQNPPTAGKVRTYDHRGVVEMPSEDFMDMVNAVRLSPKYYNPLFAVKLNPEEYEIVKEKRCAYFEAVNYCVDEKIFYVITSDHGMTWSLIQFSGPGF